MSDKRGLDLKQRAQTLYASRQWAESRAAFVVADEEAGLTPAELGQNAAASYLAGHAEESAELWARAHRGHLESSEVGPAAMSAFWIAFTLLQAGERARAGGWISRAERLLENAPDNVERGYLLFMSAVLAILEGDTGSGLARFDEAAAIGARFRESDLSALARHGQGRGRIRLGEVERGLSLLDEVMAAVDARAVSPIVTGYLYCSVLEACHEVFDLQRAGEWTGALKRWCDEQPELVPFRGQCCVRRAELLHFQGDWVEARHATRRACDWLLRPPPHRAIGAARYLQAELDRLRGEWERAEEGYREAASWGVRTDAGLSLLRLAQGDADAAAAMLRRTLAEVTDSRSRARLLPASVDVLLAVRDVMAASAAAEELAAIALSLGSPLLQAHAAYAAGAARLAQGDAAAALPVLRQGWLLFEDLGATYHAARSRVLIGDACRALGDEIGAALEHEAARRVFEELGATPDLDRIGGDRGGSTASPPAGLSPREMEVLRLVATGRTNRQIAADLFISPRTVDRHVSNILAKLAVPSRSAAAAYAVERGIA